MFSFISATTVACGNLFSDMKNVQHTEIERENEGGREREREKHTQREIENCGKSLNNKIKTK